MSFRMRPIYPYRVYGSSAGAIMNEASNSAENGDGQERLLRRPQPRRPRPPSHHDHHAHAAATVRDPVCGMTVEPRDQQAPLRLSRRDLSFLLGRLPHQIRRRSRLLSGERQQAESRGAGRHDLHLPDASGDPPGRPRKLPDLRHGAGAGGREPRCAAQSGTRRHDAPLLDRPRARAAGRRPGNGRPSRRRPWLGRSDAVELDPVRLRHARRAVGRLAVLRARLAIAASRAISTCSR